MKSLKIKFIRNRPWLTKNDPSTPKPTSKLMPDWYKKFDRFAINPATGDYWKNPHDGGKIPTWKACPAIFDGMLTGYVYRTPCDIEFYEDEDGKLLHKVLDDKNQDFVGARPPMPGFVTPPGFRDEHFAWWADWAVEVPEGYSVIYISPMNRYDLPFITTSGLIDNDKVNLPGTMPFFIAKGWTGTIPAGTPYAQLIPFKREDWESEIDYSISYEKMVANNIKNSEKYRVPDGGIYQKSVWTRRKYDQ